MSNYIELYKKYRPRTWADLVGQEAIVETLKNAISSNRVPTAYLFSGPAGTGKTSTAFILAKAMNCTNLIDEHSPCNQCETCKAIDKNRQLGVRYIAATNAGSAEDIRKLMEDARLSQPVKKQVFIIDEPQNMSRAAFDSMLIGLESETQQTLFILCTTDPQKIPPAILSRTQVRTFSSPDKSTLGKLLLEICKKEGIPVDKEHLKQAVLSSDGSVRNAVRNLELLSTGGTLPSTDTNNLIEAIVEKDLAKIFETTKSLSQDSVSISRSTEQLYRNIADMFMAQSGYNIKNAQLQEYATKLTVAETKKLLDNLGEALQGMSSKQVDYRILLEISLSKWIGNI